MKRRIGEYLQLLAEAGYVTKSELYHSGMKRVEGLTYESGKAGPGTLFVCKGASFRREYLEEAVERGAVCYVSEQDYGLKQVPCILVRNIREVMPLLAESFYQVPPGALRYIGVTGTKGKTTTTYYIRGILDEYMKRSGGRNIAYLTSVETYDGAEREASSITTPESFELYRHFRNAHDAGITYLAMEVSSQALKYKRVQGIKFDVGIFLNISEDHISPAEHRNFEDYFQSKLKLFRQVRTAIVNLDAQHSGRILRAASCAERVLTFGKTPEADIYGHDITVENGKVTFTVSCDRFEQQFTLAMHGIFNVENALAAIAAAYAAGIGAEEMKQGLEQVTVDGRMEEYTSRDRNVKAIVDYAHNGLSFEKIFDSVKLEFPDYKVVSVFGCPGGKALNRRRDMGIIAGRAYSKVYLSADDPSTERVQDISREIGRYMEATGCPYECIPDREEAIRKAIAEAEENTVILVLGKGSENSQKIGHIRRFYKSDSEIVKECMEKWASGT